MQAVVFVEGNAVGVFGCGIGEGALHLFCDFGAFDDDAHFGIEPCGTGSRLNEPMKMRLPSTMKVLACRLVTELPVRLCLCGGDGMVGLQLVEFDAYFEQRFSVFDVAGMDGGNVGRL